MIFFGIRLLVLFFVRIFEFLNEPCNIRTYMLIFNFASKGSKFVSVTQKIVDKQFFHTIKVCNTTFLSVYLQEIDFNFQGFQEQITCVYEFSFQSIEHFNEYILNEMTDQLINDEHKLVRNPKSGFRKSRIRIYLLHVIWHHGMQSAAILY